MARKFYTEDGQSIPAIKFELTTPSGYTLVTDTTELKGLYVRKYNQRKGDGTYFYNSFRVDLYMELVAETYTDVQVFALESHLKDLGTLITEGNWLTAQSFITTLALSGIYDAAMKSTIKTVIDDYVTDEY